MHPMLYHAKKILGLKRTPEFHKETRARCMKECLDKRGADFAERQRQRALNRRDWFGGKHNNGNHLPKEKKAEIALRVMHAPGVEERAREARRKTVARDKRRVALGLDPLTKILNIGEGMTHKQTSVRYEMKHECQYIIFKGDPRIYYDENTKRSARREKTASERGLYVYPISERKKFE